MPEREHPVGCGVSLHVAWRTLIDRPRTSRTANTMSRGNGVQGHTRSGADDESRTRGLDRGVVALCPLSYIRRGARRTIGQYRSSRGNLLKSVHRCLIGVGSAIHRSRGLRRCAGRLKSENKKARILSESGPLRTELGGCAPTRFPLPDAPGPRPDQATDGSPARTRPTHSRVGWL